VENGKPRLAESQAVLRTAIEKPVLRTAIDSCGTQKPILRTGATHGD